MKGIRNNRPRLLAAAIEFNIGKEPLVEFLCSMGFEISASNPNTKLTEEMYLALRAHFKDNRGTKINKNKIVLPGPIEKSAQPKTSQADTAIYNASPHDDEKRRLLNSAAQSLMNDDVVKFAGSITQLHKNHLTCNCFFGSLPDDFWKPLLKKIETIADFGSSGGNKTIFFKHHLREKIEFNLNLSKGFVYLRAKMEPEAYNYLSRAIEINPQSDLCYSLRSTIENNINPDNLNDAKEAVLLAPNARNYFMLANAYGEASAISAITYFGIAISLNPDFTCAYNNKALQHKTLKEWGLAVDLYLRCIETEPTHWCYYDLWHCLDELKDYERALRYALTGHEIHPDNWSYHFALGVANSRLSEYDAAVRHYKEYLLHNPDSQAALSNLKVVEAILRERILEDAIRDFEQNSFSTSLEKFEAYTHGGGELSDQNLPSYYWAKLKHENTNIQIGESNQLRNRFEQLHEDYISKLSRGELPSEDEENISKLIVYQEHFKIGFGNYEGYTVKEILATDPHYLLWCVINLYHFCISPSVFLHENLMLNSQYNLALEINTVKYELNTIWHALDHDEDWKDYGDDYSGYEDEYPSYEDWLEEEFGEDADTAYWNLD